MDYIAISLSAMFATLAWLYQKAWERHERRLNQYDTIIKSIIGFSEPTNEFLISRVLFEHRRLWVFGPDSIVRALNDFFNATDGTKSLSDEEKQIAIGKVVLEIRRDSSFLSAIKPRFFTTRLTPNDFRLLKPSTLNDSDL